MIICVLRVRLIQICPLWRTKQLYTLRQPKAKRPAMLKIGADPEVFVQHKDKFISAHVFRCGTKKRPMKTPNGSVQVDGMALEFNIPPSDNEVSFRNGVRALLEDLNVIVESKKPGAKIVVTPTAHFGFEYMNRLPNKAIELGCNPDWNAYTQGMNTPPNPMVPFRTGAGHVHFGWKNGVKKEDMPQHFSECCSLVRELDYYLGLPSMKWDQDGERRSLYGKAGCFRPKSYGLEYRVLSNAWLCSEDTVSTVFNQANKAFNRWVEGVIHGNLLQNEFGNYAEQAINTNLSEWDQQNPELAQLIYG